MLGLALRNIRRNIRRSALTGMSIGIAVMMVIYMWSFIMGVWNDAFDNFIRSHSGHLRILNSEYLRREKMMPLDVNIDGFRQSDDYTAVETIAKMHPDVIDVTSRIKFGVLLDHEGNNKPVMGTGIVPEKEENILGLTKKIISGRPIQMGKEEINIGAGMAKEFDLKMGDVLTIVTQTAYGSLSAIKLKVVGIFSFGTPTIDRKAFYMPLDKAQELLDLSGKVTEIFLITNNRDRAKDIAKEVLAELDQIVPGKYTTKSWQEGFLYDWLALAGVIYRFIYFLILVLASFTILNTMFMSVLERTREIGMMKSLGMKNRQIIGLVLLEALLLGVIASFFGAIVGSGISYYLSVCS